MATVSSPLRLNLDGKLPDEGRFGPPLLVVASLLTVGGAFWLLKWIMFGLPLEDSLTAFERGMVLVRQLAKRLEDIEQRVEVLLRDDQGGLRVVASDDET